MAADQAVVAACAIRGTGRSMLLRVIKSASTYQLLDQAGRPIGAVVQPVSDRIVGRAAGTVLLTRATSSLPLPLPSFHRVSGATRAISSLGQAEPAA